MTAGAGWARRSAKYVCRFWSEDPDHAFMPIALETRMASLTLSVPGCQNGLVNSWSVGFSETYCVEAGEIAQGLENPVVLRANQTGWAMMASRISTTKRKEM